MNIKRIVSFLPSATELIFELGIQDKLFGVTHECKYPYRAKGKPKVITSVLDSEKLTSNEIDIAITQLMKNGKDIFQLNEKILLEANPDLIIAQTTCKVCAAHDNQVTKAMKILEKKPIIYSMDPHNTNEILNMISDIANMTGKKIEGKKLEKNLRKRIQKFKEANHLTKPKVLALEWINPFFTAGHWVPEMVELAGGINMISKRGEHSRRLDIQNIQKADPDIIILMPCGFDMKRTLKEYKENLGGLEEWEEIDAVKRGKVFLVDANSYFSKPGIRTVTGIEVLGKIIHPNDFVDITVPKESFSYIK